MVVDGAAMLVFSVEIDGHGAAAEIDILPQVGVAAVNEVRQFRAVVHYGILHFYKVSDLDVVMKLCIRAQMNEGPDFIIVSDAAFMSIDAIQMGEIAAGHVGELGVGTDFTVRSYHGFSLEHSAREENGILPYHHVLLHIGVFRVDDGDAGCHQFFGFAEAENLVGLGELDAGIDAHGFVGIVSRHGDNLEARFDHDFKNVGQVIFALGVFVVDLRQRIHQRAGLENIGARIDFMNRQLLRRAVFLFHNGSHMPFGVAKHAAVAERIVQDGGEYGGCGAFLLTNLRKLRDGFCAEQRGVAADDEHIAVSISFQRRQRLNHRMTGAQLFFLVDEGNIFLLQCFSHQMFLETGDHYHAVESAFSDDVNDLLRHRYAAHLVQYLR